MSELNTMSISDHDPDLPDGQDWFQAHDVDLSCPTCKGSCVHKIKPEEAKIVEITPATQDEADNLCIIGHPGKEVEAGTTYFKITGSDQYADDEVYETEEDAQDALDDEDKWEEETCEDCENGYLPIIWNTIWNTGFHSIRGESESPGVYGSVAAFEYDGNIWFGLMGCGMDMSPDLIAAWFHFFPDVAWIPDQWITESNLYGGYYRRQMEDGTELEDKIFSILKDQLKSEIARKRDSLKRLNAHLKTNKRKVQKRA